MPKKPSLIDSVKKKATKKKATSKKKDEVVWEPDDKLRPLVMDLIAAGAVSDTLKPVFDQKKSFVVSEFFDRFTEDMWKTKALPANPRVAINKGGTSVRDMALMFVVKFRTNALKNYLPDEDDLEDDMTPRDMLVNDIVESTGISKENAEKLTDEEDGEFIIEDKIGTVKPLDECYGGDDPDLSSAAEKLFKYSQSAASSKKTISLPVFTEAEQAIFSVTQILMIKEGFMSRACMYCESLEQLRELLRFVKVSLVTQNYEFAIGDEPSERQSRMEEAAKKLLTTES